MANAESRKRIWDVSPPVGAETPVWPGDTPYSERPVMEMARGASCNVSAVTTTPHIGAHADAPYHFLPDGARAGETPLEHYLGRARVAERLGAHGISRGDLERIGLDGVARLLLRTRAGRGRSPFEEGFAFLEPEAARLLAERRVLLVGLDTPSVDAFDSKTLPSHKALLGGGVMILEGLDLAGVPEGDYELIALPLRLATLDASPVRAILREL